MLARDASKDQSELVILSLLEDGPQYGYAISKEVAGRSENRLRLTPGVLYPILKQLETDGLITSTWEEIRSDRGAAEGEGEGAEEGNGGGGRKRKWYRLSAKGRKRLKQRVEAHHAWRSIIDLFIGGGGGTAGDASERRAEP